MKSSTVIVLCILLLLAGCQALGDRSAVSVQGGQQVQGQGGQVQGQQQQQSQQQQQVQQAPQPGKKAMTWKFHKKDPELGIVLAGLGGGDPYHGDTLITESLPVLAIKKESLPRPNYAVDRTGGSMDKEYYRGWSGGRVKLTPPIRGTELTSLEAANDYCRKSCGEGYRMAEFHDGLVCPGMDKDKFHGDTWPGSDTLRRGGWNFWAYGEVSTDGRFWVSIDDQDANCWGR
ncbi:MAG: hypothetical protein RDV48_29355 [Candidatus Eremiobacteraeota bacterium]|nr:hypothetical protein [Candidatus Eremiobacteraeota bacterium]